MRDSEALPNECYLASAFSSNLNNNQFLKELESSMEGARRLMAKHFVQVKVPFQHQQWSPHPLMWTGLRPWDCSQTGNRAPPCWTLGVVVDRSPWRCLANVNETLHGSEPRGIWKSSFGFLCWCVLFWFPHADLCCGWAGLRSGEGKEGDIWSLCNVCTLCKCNTFNFFYFQDV